jgi:NAD(P)-dependent dehydrogenase (short-subunit alcohol dehydrogenase family)
MEFTDKIALVTGASRGLGRAVALALATGGAHVIAVARTVGGLEELDTDIQAAGGSATLVPLDLTDDPGVERLGAAIFERWKRVDILVHCAAQGVALSPAHTIGVKDLDQALAVNARAPQRLIRSLDALLRAAPAGQAVFCDDPVKGKFWGAYAASKAAARAMVESYAAETAQAALSVWLAQPPAMPTNIRAVPFPGEDKAALTPCEDVAEWLVGHIAAGDVGAGKVVSFPTS